jgi:cell shape-determining protein MreC
VRQSSRTSWLLAAACLGAGGLLCAAPAALHDRLRGAILDGLKPGMRLAVAAREGRPERSSSGNPVAVGEREQELDNALKSANLKSRQLEIESARLREELEQLRSEKPKPFLGEAGLPLFAPDLLTARVLDSPSTDEVERTILTLDEGHMARVALAEWVLGDDGLTIDQGADSGVLADSPVLAGRSVFGRVASTGRFTSRIQHLSDPSFRAHAKLMRRSGEQTVSGAEGLLAGAGEGQCRLELIAATEPVEPGDLIVTAATIPGIDDELYLGEVQTATLPPGAAHWTIKVTPAVSTSECRQVQVVRVGLHPGRKPVETAEVTEGPSR